MFKINYKINLNLLEEFNNYAHCYCCERHQKNRPEKIMPLSLLKIEITSEGKNDCLCNCRHNARMLCNNLDNLGYFCIDSTKILDNNLKKTLNESSNKNKDNNKFING